MNNGKTGISNRAKAVSERLSLDLFLCQNRFCFKLLF